MSKDFIEGYRVTFQDIQTIDQVTDEVRNVLHRIDISGVMSVVEGGQGMVSFFFVSEKHANNFVRWVREYLDSRVPDDEKRFSNYSKEKCVRYVFARNLFPRNKS